MIAQFSITNAARIVIIKCICHLDGRILPENERQSVDKMVL